jgi:hypothetical protein
MELMFLQADGGGSLVCEKDGQWYKVGIFSLAGCITLDFRMNLETNNMMM